MTVAALCPTTAQTKRRHALTSRRFTAAPMIREPPARHRHGRAPWRPLPTVARHAEPDAVQAVRPQLIVGQQDTQRTDAGSGRGHELPDVNEPGEDGEEDRPFGERSQWNHVTTLRFASAESRPTREREVKPPQAVRARARLAA
jgi:hypothetical protein